MDSLLFAADENSTVCPCSSTRDYLRTSRKSTLIVNFLSRAEGAKDGTRQELRHCRRSNAPYTQTHISFGLRLGERIT